MPRLLVKGHSVPKDHSNRTKYRVRDLEDLPERAKMKEGYGWSEGPLDNLKPLLKFLKSRIGHRWSKVYSEICAVADHRTFAGKHMLEHVEWLVHTEYDVPKHLRYRDFYVDANGILHGYFPENTRRKHYWGRRLDPNECEIDGSPFLRVNNCWFEAKYEHKLVWNQEWDVFLRKTVKRSRENRFTVAVRQLNKKELKKLRLSNEIGWNWYDKRS